MPISPEIKQQVNEVYQLGQAVRQARKLQGLSQSDLAAISGVGIRFVSELENGKPSIHFGKTIEVLQSLGLSLTVGQREWR